MACISATKKAFYQSRITALTAQLEAAETAAASGFSTDIKEYRFDSGEGSQRVEYRSHEELTRTIDWCIARIAHYQKLLAGKGLVSMNLRRQI